MALISFKAWLNFFVKYIERPKGSFIDGTFTTLNRVQWQVKTDIDVKKKLLKFEDGLSQSLGSSKVIGSFLL